MDKSLTPIFLFAAFMLGTARFAPRWALRRPALVGVLTAALVVWGLVSMRGLPVELMPNAASDTVTVTVGVRGGMSPTDVEALIVRPLEDGLGDLPRLKTLISSAKKDRGVVTLDFHPGVDMKRVTAEVNERVDRALTRLPAEIEKPVIAHFEENDAPVYIAAVLSDRLSPESVRKIIDDNIKDHLLRTPGVANVEIGGGREGKILVELNRDRLAAYGLSPHQITSLLGRRNVALQVGSVTGDARVTPVRLVGTLKNLEEFRKVVVARDPSGGTVLLENVATVTDSYLEPESLSRLNGQAAVSLYVQKESSANTLRVVRDLEKAWDRAWRNLPAGTRKDLRHVVVSNQAVGILAAVVSVRVSLACGILLILLSLCLVESERLSTKRMAGVVMGGLLALMCVTAFLKISDARMEPLYWILLGLFLLLAFFDPDIRPGLIVAGSMPLSAFFCFLLFQACGLTLNVMSLFGLALGLGMLVDNATVVYEHINELGLPPPGPAAREAALKATEEMVIPLIGGTVTNAIVFVPFLFLSREIQLMYTDVAAAVGASLFASLGISLTAVPLLASGLVLKGAPKWPTFPGRFESRAKKWGENINRLGTLLWERGAAYSKLALERTRAFYAARLKPRLNSLAGHHSLAGLPPWAALVLFVVLFAGLWALGGKTPAKVFFLLTALGLTAAGFALFRGFEGHWRGLFHRRVEILGAALLLAAAATAVIFKATERDFQTSGELDEFVVFLELSSGVRLEVSNAVAAEVEKILDTDPEVSPTIKTAVSRVEGWSSKIYVTLVPRAQRRLSAEQVQDLLRVKLKGVGSDKDPNAFVHFSSPRTGQEITVEVLGPDYGVLEQLAQQICGSLEKIPGLSDVKMRYRPGRPEVLAVVDPDRAARAGLSAEAVAETTHALVRGLRATTFRTGGRQTETIVRLRREDSENLNALADLPLGGPGRTLRLTEVADLTMSKMPNEIFRENKARLIQITANRTRLSLGRAAEEIQAALDAMNFPLDYHAALDREVTDMARSINQLTAGILVMIFLVYVVLVVLFESLVEPFIILSAVPLCLIGVAGGLVFFGLPLSTGVLVGVIMLAGVVVNNAIMLLDHLNNYTDRDEPLADRLRKSVLARMRPIFLTAGSAVLGFLPMMLDTSESGVLWRPLAVTLVFGLIFSTVLTLYVTPALTHFLLKDIPQWLTGRRFLAKTAPNPTP